jgi:hypothetical protein
VVIAPAGTSGALTVGGTIGVDVVAATAGTGAGAAAIARPSDPERHAPVRIASCVMRSTSTGATALSTPSLSAAV